MSSPKALGKPLGERGQRGGSGELFDQAAVPATCPEGSVVECRGR